MDVTIKLISLKIIDNGDPSHETKGELFYSFRIDGRALASQPKSKPVKVTDGQLIKFDKSVTLKDISKRSPHIVFSGYAGDVDTGFNGKNEFDSFKVFLTGRNKWKAGQNSVYIKDGRLNLKLVYKVTVRKNEPITMVQGDMEIAGPRDVFREIRPTKSASVTIVSFLDGKFRNLVQNGYNNYGKAFDDYDKSVVIKLVYNEPKQPTEVVQDIGTPSILATLKGLADEGYFIDLFIHSHGNCDVIAMKNDHVITPDNIASLATGAYANGRFPLRMVYQINCNGSTLNDDWIAAGAKAVCGAAQTNFHPNQYNPFIKDWNDGHRFDMALLQSNTASSRTLMQSLIVADAISVGSGCSPFQTVLGKNNCARLYFNDRWFTGDCDVYDEDISGKRNMNSASRMVIHGDFDLRKTDTNLAW